MRSKPTGGRLHPLKSGACPWRPPRSPRRRCARSRTWSRSTSTGSARSGSRGRSRRSAGVPGCKTVFMTLRDAVADISIPLTVPRERVDGLATPLVEGASVVVLAKPSYYANRGSFSLAVREIRMVGLGELLARLERRRQLLAAEGLFARELKRSLPFLPHRVGLVTAPESAAERDVLDNARRRWPNVAFEVAYATMQGQRAAAEVIEALGRLERHPDVDVIVVARGGGSVEDLLPFSDEALVRAVPRDAHAGRLRHRPRAGPAAARPGRRRARLDADRRGQARRARRVARSCGWSTPPGTGSVRCWPAGWPASRPASTRCAPGRCSATRVVCSTSGAPRSASCATAGRRTLAHRLDRAGDDVDHLRARARALSPLATLERGYAVLQDADGHVVTSVAGVEPDVDRERAGGRRPRARGDHRHHPHRAPRGERWLSSPTRPRPTRPPARSWSRRSRRLEAGGTTLEESLALWERGEQLATICQQWLDGVRQPARRDPRERGGLSSPARRGRAGPRAPVTGPSVEQADQRLLVRDRCRAVDQQRLAGQRVRCRGRRRRRGRRPRRTRSARSGARGRSSGEASSPWAGACVDVVREQVVARRAAAGPARRTRRGR